MDISLTGDDLVKIIKEGRKSNLVKFRLGELIIEFEANPRIYQGQPIEIALPASNDDSPITTDEDPPAEDENYAAAMQEYQEILEDPSKWQDRLMNPEKYEE